MRAKRDESGATRLWLSADDTYEWARDWPCSSLRGRRVFAAFAANGDLIDLAVNGRSDENIDGHEFNACASDFLRARFGHEHPAIRS